MPSILDRLRRVSSSSGRRRRPFSRRGGGKKERHGSSSPVSVLEVASTFENPSSPTTDDEAFLDAVGSIESAEDLVLPRFLSLSQSPATRVEVVSDNACTAASIDDEEIETLKKDDDGSGDGSEDDTHHYQEEKNDKDGEETTREAIPAKSAFSRRPSSPTQSSLKGRQVQIVKGQHKNKFATVLGWKNKGTYEVELLAEGGTVGVRTTSVVFVDPPTGTAEPVHSNVKDPNTNNRKRLAAKDTPSDSNDPWLHQRVSIQAGANRGKKGTVMAKKNKSTYSVELESGGGVVGVRVSSLQLIGDSTGIKTHNGAQEESPLSLDPKKLGFVSRPKRQPSPAAPISLQNNENSHDGMVGQYVRIVKGVHKNKFGTVAREKNKNTYTVDIEGKEVGVRKSSVQLPESAPIEEEEPQSKPSRSRGIGTRAKHQLSKDTATGEAWRVADHEQGGLRIGSRLVLRQRLEDEDAKQEITFLSHVFGNRIRVLDVSLNGRTNQKPFDKTFQDHDSKYELVSAKVYDDHERGGTYGKPKLVRLMYAQVEGPGLTPFSLDEALLRLGDFSRLVPRKIMARLELLQSPAKFDVVFSSASEFCRIPEMGNVGGGFVSDEKMVEICVQGGMTESQAEKVVALQVRLIIPTMGICKGMLMRKRIESGPPIQLPDSMFKVPKSECLDVKQDTAIVVCKNGVHPSPGSANEYIGRRLDPLGLRPPPEKSFKEKIKTPLSDMVFRLWKSMGVSGEACKEYKKKSLQPENRNHAWLVGVPDPTGTLPPDTVFVPGMKSAQPDELFVTRSPCVKHEDGRILASATSKPSGMTQIDWEWLNSLPFGCIIFSNPREGRMSVPERIANGDLDGDLYLVCWDETILSQMEASPLPDLELEDDGKLKTLESADPEWLDKAQEMMLDAGKLNAMGQLTGKLYKLGEKIADKSVLGLKDPDAAACFEAYNCALEFKKHGGGISLPEHLHDKIPKKLRQYLA